MKIAGFILGTKAKVVEVDPSTRADVIKKIQAKEVEVKRLKKEKVRLQGIKGTPPMEINKVNKKLEAGEQELQRLKALR